MNTSKNQDFNNSVQIEIVPQRILSLDTAKNLLNEIYSCGHILRVMIQGSNLPDFVSSGPGKGEKVNHPLKKKIDICGQQIDIKTTIGRLYLEVENDEIASRIYEKCKKILKFPFEYYKGTFFKEKATIVDYVKFGKNIDKNIIGLSEPKSNIKDNIDYIDY